ncbi:MAG TPA: hypothetical protein VFF73_22990, partial [Planctomycetota bacterium]|nr:hypothetical protein [Planctomycetota bacterium]
EATGALQVGEWFLLDVGEGRLLYLRGSYLADAVRRGAFPSTSFTLVRLPRAGLTLRVECHGRTLPAWTRSGRDHPRKDELSRHGDCTVMSGTLVSFAEVA